MKLLLLSLVLTASASAQAAIISCNFTEPFFSLKYDTTTYELVRTENDGNGEVVTETKSAALLFKSSTKFELISEDKKVLLKLNLNFNGSDGMSDIIYPYEAELLMEDGSSLWGGCESNYLAAKR